ncbi:toll/interleukin-1 receptor domain-containing protein [Phormidesmis sp. 146-33]
MSDVFISYSRKDKVFVERLHEALLADQRETWVDWQDIPLTADWWHEIERGIEGTNTFVFVISPDAIASQVCRDEIDHAVRHNKRVVPIVRRDGFEMAKVHPVLSKHNWLFFRETDEFDRGFRDLVGAIEMDLGYVRSHTRLTERAVEWEGKQRNESFLLRGSDLEDAEQWLTQGASKQPQPTELQGEYLGASRRGETARQRAEAKKQRVFVGIVGGLAIASTGIAVFAFQQRRVAILQRNEARLSAQSSTSLNLSASKLTLEALAEGLKAGHNLKQWEKDLDSGTSMQVKANLQQVVYRINERNRLEGHSYVVRSVSFSPDGQTIASGSTDSTVKLWDLQGRELQTLKGHSSAVTSVSFRPDGQTIASGSTDNTVKLWDRQGRELQTLKGHSHHVYSVSFSPDGQTIASGSWGWGDNTVRLWDRQGQELQTLKGHGDAVSSVNFSPDGQTIASGSWDSTVKLWDRQGRELQTLKGNSGAVNSVSFSPDGQMIATGSDDSTVKLWDLQGRELQTLKGHSSSVSSVSFSPDGKTIASGSDDGTIILWNLNLDSLMTLGCDWLLDYRTNNPNGQQDRELNEACGETKQSQAVHKMSLWQKFVAWVWQS